MPDVDTYISDGFEILWMVPRINDNPQKPVRFVDADTLELWREGGESSFIATYRRRFPEWWWGHFYRPEVWLFITLSGILIWRFVMARKRSGRDARAP